MNNLLLDGKWVKEEIKKENLNFLELNDNENARPKKDFWDTLIKADLWGRGYYTPTANRNLK